MNIADEIAALPEWPSRGPVDSLIKHFPNNKVIEASAIAGFAQAQADAALTRLALARRLLLETRHSFGTASDGVVFRDIAQWVKDRDALLAAMEPPK